MNEIEKHNYYRKILIDAYHLSVKNMKKKYKIINYDSNALTGFKSYAIKDGDNIIFTTIGTNSIQDIISDFKLLKKRIPSHVYDLKFFIKQTISNPIYKNCKIILNGHSLGASADTIVATKFLSVDEVVGFNPYGTRDLIGNAGIKHSLTPMNKMINYCNLDDDIVTLKLNQQVGVCYTMYTKNLKDAHFIDNIESLSTRRLFNQKDENLNTRIKHRKEILQNTKIFTENLLKEILNTTEDLSEKGVDSVKYYMNKSMNGIKNYTTPAIKKIKPCVGSYNVSGYTRADGTKVSSYTRICGAKHAGMSESERLAGRAKYIGKKFQDIPEDELEEAISFFI